MTETVLLRCKPSAQTHGLSGHPLYYTWKSMLSRCEDPKNKSYKNYGRRGITVCERWHDPVLFIADIERLLGPKPEGCTLDRIETYHGNYGPGEVRWATDEEQQRNRRVLGGCPIQCADCALPSTKTCTTCGPAEGPKDASEFYANSHGGLENECKECKKARSAAWNAANPERYKANQATMRASTCNTQNA